MTKKTYIAVLAIALFALFGVDNAFAATTFNTDPNDRATVRVSNYTANPGTTVCWSNTIPGTSPQSGCNNPTLQAGDLVSIAIYYHNTGTETATNTRVRLNTMSGTQTSFSAIGGVMADNASYKSGSASFNISSAQSVTYNACYWYPNQTQSAHPCPGNGTDIFTSQGLNIGSIAPGWATQGSVVIRMRVSNNTPPPPPQTYACNDGHDNDNDGKVDMNDPGCSSPTDNDEYNTPPCTTNCGGCNNCVAGDIDTDPATSVTKSSAQLNAHFDTNNTQAWVWFEWGTSSFSHKTPDMQKNFTSGNASQWISGLSDDTTYKFRACIKNSYDSHCDGVEYFTTADAGCGNNCGCGNDCDDDCDTDCDNDCDDDCNDGDEPEVTTLSADDVEEDEALLMGEVDPNGDAIDDIWFEWGEDDDDLDETLHVSSFDDNEEDDEFDFEKRLTGLDEDTTYYFRACAENDNGEDCGSIRSFTTDEDDNDNDDNDGDAPQVSTTGATSITQTSARLNGVVDTNGDDDTRVWFEWGTSTSLSYDTNDMDALDGSHISRDTYSFGSTISGLQPATTYYFRAVAENDEGDDFGAIQSFRTLAYPATPVTPPTPIIYNTTVVGSGTGDSLVMLEIETRDETVYPGDRVSYTVRYENISGKTLKNVVLHIQFPNDIEFIDSDEGDYSERDNELTLELGTLEPKEEDEFDIDARVGLDARDGDLLVTTATLAFTTPSGAQEDAVAYALHDVREGNVLGASAIFGWNGFWPDSLIGWLILILLIIAIILVARRAFRPKTVYVATPPAPPAY